MLCRFPRMSKLQYEDAIWPLMVFMFIMGVALWSTTIIPTAGISSHKVRKLARPTLEGLEE